MRHVLAALFVLGLVNGAAHAQQAARPSPDLLQAGTDTLYQYLVQGADTTFIGTVVDVIERVSLGGRAVIRRIYLSDSRLSGGTRDTIIDDAATLRPVRTASYSTRAIEKVEYGPDRASGWIRQPNGDSLRIDVAVPVQVYAAASFDVVIRASALDEGWSATVPAFVASSRVVVPMTARVVREERIDEWECWRVDAEYMGMPVTFWVERETRRLCRQEMRPRVGLSLLYTHRAPRGPRRGAT